MEELIGSSITVFIGLTLIIMGFAAVMTGQAVANTWAPAWHGIFYCVLLGCADRFLHFSLFGGELFSLTGYIIDTVVLIALCLAAFRITQVRKIVAQYPWLYEKTGLFGWRSKAG